MPHLNIRISGTVQGVSFRAFVKREAQKLGLLGFVENRLDGSVYIEVEGSAASLHELVKKCRVGSGLAQVDQVTEELAPSQNFKQFIIKQ